MNRFNTLTSLINFNKPISELSEELSKLDWDYEGTPLVVSGTDIKRVLQLYLDGECTAKELEDWANLIECREDLEFEEELIEEIIYKLSNPVLEGEVTIESCSKLLAQFNRVT
ncbi:hypothetical protein [Thalassomonas haliotis]|uniref:Uncharacterized protein n=1 Tax=Thalassomonas haliotis TaxID=485448 RepID=A0ABY7VE85_9GAMM|nr:hypothetical protein [Thalassomonas haliotis]WDE11745.1 hypothetical protein H3N35_26725 [Thalassomonas haliotis]